MGSLQAINTAGDSFAAIYLAQHDFCLLRSSIEGRWSIYKCNSPKGTPYDFDLNSLFTSKSTLHVFVPLRSQYRRRLCSLPLW